MRLPGQASFESTIRNHQHMLAAQSETFNEQALGDVFGSLIDCYNSHQSLFIPPMLAHPGQDSLHARLLANMRKVCVEAKKHDDLKWLLSRNNEVVVQFKRDLHLLFGTEQKPENHSSPLSERWKKIAQRLPGTAEQQARWLDALKAASMPSAESFGSIVVCLQLSVTYGLFILNSSEVAHFHAAKSWELVTATLAGMGIFTTLTYINAKLLPRASSKNRVENRNDEEQPPAAPSRQMLEDFIHKTQKIMAERKLTVWRFATLYLLWQKHPPGEFISPEAQILMLHELLMGRKVDEIEQLDSDFIASLAFPYLGLELQSLQEAQPAAFKIKLQELAQQMQAQRPEMEARDPRPVNTVFRASQIVRGGIEFLLDTTALRVVLAESMVKKAEQGASPGALMVMQVFAYMMMLLVAAARVYIITNGEVRKGFENDGLIPRSEINYFRPTKVEVNGEIFNDSKIKYLLYGFLDLIGMFVITALFPFLKLAQFFLPEHTRHLQDITTLAGLLNGFDDWLENQLNNKQMLPRLAVATAPALMTGTYFFAGRHSIDEICHLWGMPSDGLKLVFNGYFLTAIVAEFLIVAAKAGWLNKANFGVVAGLGEQQYFYRFFRTISDHALFPLYQHFFSQQDSVADYRGFNDVNKCILRTMMLAGVPLTLLHICAGVDELDNLFDRFMLTVLTGLCMKFAWASGLLEVKATQADMPSVQALVDGVCVDPDGPVSGKTQEIIQVLQDGEFGIFAQRDGLSPDQKAAINSLKEDLNSVKSELLLFAGNKFC